MYYPGYYQVWRRLNGKGHKRRRATMKKERRRVEHESGGERGKLGRIKRTQKKVWLSSKSIKQTSRNIRRLFDRLIQQMARARSRQIMLSWVSRREEKKQVEGVKVPLPFMWKLWNVAADKTEGEARDRHTSCFLRYMCACVFLYVCGPFMRQSSRLRKERQLRSLAGGHRMEC